jgi:hypothetical protein
MWAPIKKRDLLALNEIGTYLGQLRDRVTGRNTSGAEVQE